MDTFVFTAHSKFILAAADANYETLFKGTQVNHSFANKVFKINDQCILSGIGNQFKVWDVYKYIRELSRLGHLTSYDEVLVALQEVFNSEQSDWEKLISETNEIIEKTRNGRDEIPAQELLTIFADKPGHLAILKDVLTGMEYDQPIITQFRLLGWDEKLGHARAIAFVIVGHKLQSSEIPFESNLIYMQSASATLPIEETIKYEQEAAQKLSPLAAINMMDTPIACGKIIEASKTILSELLNDLNPYKKEPMPVYYELSERTNFKFKLPDIELKDITFNRI